MTKKAKEAVILHPQINEVIEQSKITDLTKAQQYAANYAPIMNEVQEYMEAVKRLTKGNPEDVATARRIRIDLGHIASKATEQKKKDKDTLLIETRYIDSLFNVVDGAARLTQGEAKEIEEHFERIEKERIEKLAAQRQAEIEPYTEALIPGLGEMADEVYSNMLEGLKLGHAARIAAQEEAERVRVENERLDRLEYGRKVEIAPYSQFIGEAPELRNMPEDKYQDLLKSLQKARLDHEAEQAKIREENERLRKESEEKEKQAKAAQAAADKAAADAKAKADAALKAERDKAAALQAEIDRKAKADADAKAAADKQAKAAALAPDKDKIKAFAQVVLAAQLPEVSSKEAKAVIQEIANKREGFVNWIILQSENVK